MHIRTYQLIIVLLIGALLALAVFIAMYWSHMSSLRSELLGRQELQNALLERGAQLGPHIAHHNRKISYVLNPAQSPSSYQASHGYSYHVNQFGLRGTEILPKRKDVPRLVIMGDSVVFGWLLQDRERIDVAIQQELRTITGREIDVIIVGLPGWNTRDQVAFLRSHLSTLQPDALVWSVINNDILDSAGVLTSGYLSERVVTNGSESGLLTPALTGRIVEDYSSPLSKYRTRENLLMIEKVSRELGLNVFIIGPYDLLRQQELSYFGDNRLLLSQAMLQNPKFKVKPNDGHPSAWGTNLMAREISARIASNLNEFLAGFTPSPEYKPGKLRDEFSQLKVTNNWSNRLHPDYFATLRATDQALGGIDDDYSMFETGAFWLGRNRNETILSVGVKLPAAVTRFPLVANFNVYGLGAGNVATKTYQFVFTTQEVKHEIKLSDEFLDSRVVIFQWDFNRVECSGPLHCIAAQLTHARLF